MEIKNQINQLNQIATELLENISQLTPGQLTEIKLITTELDKAINHNIWLDDNDDPIVFF